MHIFSCFPISLNLFFFVIIIAMNRTIILLFSFLLPGCCLPTSSSSSSSSSSAPPFFLMPWMCLERCGDNSTVIQYQLQQLTVNISKFTGVSFEDYNLGPNSTLIKNNLTQVASLIPSTLQRWAMISSYPYPPDFLYWMRDVFTNPQPFIDSCLAAAKTEKLSGFNIDWEPTDGNGAPVPTKEDAVSYAQFLQTFTVAMHQHGILTSVDVATWSPIWNYTLIGQTDIDYVCTMGTYTSPWNTWQEQFQYGLANLPKEKYVVGLEIDDSINSTDVQLRFQAIQQANIHQIAIWRMTIPDFWWSFIDNFVSSAE